MYIKLQKPGRGRAPVPAPAPPVAQESRLRLPAPTGSGQPQGNCPYNQPLYRPCPPCRPSTQTIKPINYQVYIKTTNLPLVPKGLYSCRHRFQPVTTFYCCKNRHQAATFFLPVETKITPPPHKSQSETHSQHQIDPKNSHI